MSDVTAPRQRARPEMSGPVLGMVLFVASEAMFFAAFFGGTSRSGRTRPYGRRRMSPTSRSTSRRS